MADTFAGEVGGGGQKLIKTRELSQQTLNGGLGFPLVRAAASYCSIIKIEGWEMIPRQILLGHLVQ
jgi:hypothetical protein